MMSPTSTTSSNNNNNTHGLRSRRHSNSNDSNNHNTADWSHHPELDDVLLDNEDDNNNQDKPISDVVLTMEDDGEGWMSDDSDDELDNTPRNDNDAVNYDYDLPPAFLIYNAITKKRAMEDAKRRHKKYDANPYALPESPDEIIMEDYYGITWTRFWMITCGFVCLLLCFFGLLMGILVGVNGKCFLRNGGCHSQEFSYHQLEKDHGNHVDKAGNPYNVPVPAHGVDYIFHVCSSDSLTTGSQEDQDRSHRLCEDECAAATCCWKDWQLCHGEAECRAYDPCQNLWHLKTEEGGHVHQEGEEAEGNNNSNNNQEQPQTQKQQEYTLTQVEDACFNHQGTALCHQVCQVGACCWDTESEHPCPYSSRCDIYEPCKLLLNEKQDTTVSDNNVLSFAEVVQQSCRLDANADLSKCVDVCARATCCFTTDINQSCAVKHPEEHIRCSDYEPCDVIYHPEKYHMN